jgi:hypothetical protein
MTVRVREGDCTAPLVVIDKPRVVRDAEVAHGPVIGGRQSVSRTPASSQGLCVVG